MFRDGFLLFGNVLAAQFCFAVISMNYYISAKGKLFF